MEQAALTSAQEVAPQGPQGPSVLADFSEDVQNHPFIQDDLAYFSEMAGSDKGTKRDKRMLSQIQNDPERYVKEVIKYYEKEIESDRSNGLPTARYEQTLSDLQDLLGTIQAEKQAPKGVQAEAAVAPEIVAPEVVIPPVAPQVAPEVAPIEEAPTEEVLTEEAIPVEEDEDLAALNEQIAAIENAPAEEEIVTEEVPAAPVEEAPVAAEEVVATEQVSPPATAPKKGKGVTIEFPTELSVSEVKPYAEVPDNYYRPDQQLKFNQGNYYEPVRVIAHPDVIRAISIGSKLGKFEGKKSTISDADIKFAGNVAKKLGYTSENGEGSARLLSNAVKDLAKENRSKNEEVFMVIGNEAKAPKPAPVTPTAVSETPALRDVESTAKTVKSDLAGVIKARLRKEGVSQDERNRLTGTRENPIVTSATKSDYETLLESYKKQKEEQLSDFEEGGKEEGKFIPEKGVFISSDTSFYDNKIKAVEELLSKEQTPPAAPKAQPVAEKKEEKAAPKEEKKDGDVESFETSKGSVYTVLPDGRTQRFKTATKELNEPNDLIVFVKFKNAQQEQDFLSAQNRQNGQKLYVIDSKGNKYDTNEQVKGKDVRLAIVKDGKVVETVETSLEPKIGYNTFDQRRYTEKGEGYRSTHLGNKVTKINYKKPSPKTPQEGDTVNLPPQSKYSTTPRKMVFKDGQWKQEVGGEITSVGEPVQKQAQEAFSGKKEAKAEETKPAPKAPETKPAETKPAEFTSKQESSASEEFDGTKKPSKIKMKTFDGKHGKGAFERMQNITQNFEDIMDGLSDKIKQDCL
jgi:hypothetical protein